MEIVIIEDDSSIRENLQEILEAYQYEVRAYPNGLQGLRGIEELIPDMVICDIMTPEMDGFEVLKTLKSKHETANIPFIFLTAKVERADQRKGMELGADDYIVKPFSAQELLNAIEIRLQKQKYTESKIQTELDDKLKAFAKINSHEYNTPLNGIIGLSEILESSADTLSKDEIIEITQAIKSSAKRLHRTFRSFLYYFQLQRGHISKHISAMNADWLQNYCKTTLTEKAFKFNRLSDTQFSSNLADDFSTQLDVNNLSYMIEELIWNAFKFSEPGTPVSVAINPSSNGFIIHVSNTNQEGLFLEKVEPFKQFGREEKEQQGSGLGLYVCKKITEYYGWHLSEKRENNQTTISLEVIKAS